MRCSLWLFRRSSSLHGRCVRAKRDLNPSRGTAHFSISPCRNRARNSRARVEPCRGRDFRGARARTQCRPRRRRRCSTAGRSLPAFASETRTSFARSAGSGRRPRTPIASWRDWTLPATNSRSVVTGGSLRVMRTKKDCATRVKVGHGIAERLLAQGAAPAARKMETSASSDICRRHP